MFYATRTQQITTTLTVHQALAFYTKADREAWLAANKGRAITAAENKKLKSAGTDYTISDQALGMVFFARTVNDQ